MVVVRPGDLVGGSVKILFAVFFLLFAAWMFLGWMIGESRDIRWMRNWCAGIFVVVALVSCLAGGALMARRMTQASCRASVQEFSKLLNERAKQGRMEDVRDAIQHLAEQPDDWSSHSPDILARMTELTQALEKTARPRVAVKSESK